MPNKKMGCIIICRMVFRPGIIKGELAMKDKENNNAMGKLTRRQIEMEHRLFYMEMLSKGKDEIYHSCNKIHFWECIHEYFDSHETLGLRMPEFNENCGLISSLWELYLKREDLNVDSWSGIEELIKAFENRSASSISIYGLKSEDECLTENIKGIINDFCLQEYGHGADFSDLSDVEVAYTDWLDDLTAREHAVQVSVDIQGHSVRTSVDGVIVDEQRYGSLGELAENGLGFLDFDSLVSLSDEAVERLRAKEPA